MVNGGAEFTENSPDTNKIALSLVADDEEKAKIRHLHFGHYIPDVTRWTETLDVHACEFFLTTYSPHVPGFKLNDTFMRLVF